MNEIDPQKLEMLRQAFPRGLAAGDGGLVDARGTPQDMPQFSGFRSNTTQQKLRNLIPEFTDVPQVGSAGGDDIPPHPWQVTLRTENGVTQYKVDFNSTLYSGLGSFNNLAVTGLDFWATASVGYLYLFGVVENGICTDASIQGPAEIPSDRVDFVGVEQNSFSALIAYLYDDGSGGITVQQRAFHDFTIINACINGRPSIYPIAT